jgi:hypothetical protein
MGHIVQRAYRVRARRLAVTRKGEGVGTWHQLRALHRDEEPVEHSLVNASYKPVSTCYRSSAANLKKTTEIFMKNGVFWDVTLCDSYNSRRFGGTYHLHN